MDGVGEALWHGVSQATVGRFILGAGGAIPGSGDPSRCQSEGDPASALGPQLWLLQLLTLPSLLPRSPPPPRLSHFFCIPTTATHCPLGGTHDGVCPHSWSLSCCLGGPSGCPA